jgi:hypothetical protein
MDFESVVLLFNTPKIRQIGQNYRSYKECCLSPPQNELKIEPKKFALTQSLK